MSVPNAAALIGKFVEEARDFCESICADALQLFDRFIHGQIGIVGDCVEHRAGHLDARGAKFGSEFVGCAPLPAIVGADRLKRLFEHREVQLPAQLEVCVRRFGGFDFAGETQAQHAQNVIGKGQAREPVRQFAVRHIFAKLAR